MSTFFEPAQLAEAMRRLHAGEVIAMPAEGVYGYCADPFNPKALAKLIALKQRDPGKGFVTLIGSLRQLPRLCETLPPVAHGAAMDHWPGQITLLLPALEHLPELLTGGHPTVAVRLPAADYMRAYLSAWGQPLVSTSANVTGEPPITDATQLPPELFALTLTKPLAGGVSKILNPATGVWVRK